ncbi:site-specific integrase, partial [Klebsiella pneumoniae]|nr:site-specific integrase [Klebsiella pneumoniae]
MTVKKLSSGEWLCDFRVNGRESRRVRKRFTTKGEAVAYEQYYRDEAKDKPWMS